MFDDELVRQVANLVDRVGYEPVEGELVGLDRVALSRLRQRLLVVRQVPVEELDQFFFVVRHRRRTILFALIALAVSIVSEEDCVGVGVERMVAVVEEVEVAAQLLLHEVDLVVAVHLCVLVKLV